MITETFAFDRPLDLARSVERHSRWGLDPVNVVTGSQFYRITPAGAAYRARQSGLNAVDVTVYGGDMRDAESDLRHRLADRLPQPNAAALGHAAVRDLYDRFPGYRPPLVTDPFESIITSISAQQVNLTWATTTRRRLVHTYGVRNDVDGVELWAFPRPESLAGASITALRDLQFTTAKSEYIIGVANAAVDGALTDLESLPDSGIVERVTALRGVGRWTADWLLARCFGRGSAVAAGDLGVRKAVSWFVAGTDKLLSEQEVRELVAPWGDGANWAVHLLLERLADR